MTLCGTSGQCQSWTTVCNCSHVSLAQELKTEDVHDKEISLP